MRQFLELIQIGGRFLPKKWGKVEGGTDPPKRIAIEQRLDPRVREDDNRVAGFKQMNGLFNCEILRNG